MIKEERTFKSSLPPILVLIFAFVYAAANILRWGGDIFVQSMNNVVTIVLAFLITMTFIFLWLQISKTGENRTLWLGMMLGWILWTIAEIWWGLSSYLNQELPYPSMADVFWLLGFIPMYTALIIRLRSLPKIENPASRFGFWLLSVISIGLTIFFVVVPVLQSYDSSDALASILSIFYPMADLVLLILVLFIFFNFQKGIRGSSWLWLSLGFILLVLSDMIFAYADSNGIYYPDGQANLISTMAIDYTYNISYLFIWVGTLVTLSVRRIHQSFQQTDIELSPIPNTHVLVFLDHDGYVEEASANCKIVFGSDEIKGKTLHDLIGLPFEDRDQVSMGYGQNRNLEEREIQIKTRLGVRTCFISGLSIMDPQGEFEGSIILLRLFWDDFSLDETITDYEKGVILNVIKKSDCREEFQIKDFLLHYYIPYFRSIYNLLLKEGGAMMADGYLAELKSLAQEKGWEADFNPQTLLNIQNLSLVATQKALPALVKSAYGIAVKVTDETTVDSIFNELRVKDSEVIKQSLSFFERPDLLILHHHPAE